MSSRRLRAAGQLDAASRFCIPSAGLYRPSRRPRCGLRTTGWVASGAAFFEVLNRSIIADNAERLEDAMLFIRLVVNHITRPAHTLREATITWRGSKLTPELAKIRIGIVVRPPMFVATSRRAAAAAHFMSNNVLIHLSIPAGCRNAFRSRSSPSSRQHGVSAAVHAAAPDPKIQWPPWEAGSDCH